MLYCTAVNLLDAERQGGRGVVLVKIKIGNKKSQLGVIIVRRVGSFVCSSGKLDGRRRHTLSRARTGRSFRGGDAGEQSLLIGRAEVGRRGSCRGRDRSLGFVRRPRTSSCTCTRGVMDAYPVFRGGRKGSSNALADGGVEREGARAPTPKTLSDMTEPCISQVPWKYIWAGEVGGGRA